MTIMNSRKKDSANAASGTMRSTASRMGGRVLYEIHAQMDLLC